MTATLIQLDGVPFVQIAFPTLQDDEMAVLPIEDAERFAVAILNLTLSTKPDDDPIAQMARRHLAAPSVSLHLTPTQEEPQC